jgi:hypothetical protein
MAKQLTMKEKLAMFSGVQFLLGEYFSTVDFLPQEDYVKLMAIFDANYRHDEEFQDELVRIAKKLAHLMLKEEAN